MSCNCKNTPTFKEKLKIAKLLTETTGETHVIFIKEVVKEMFICKLSDLNDSLQIVSYYMPDGTELAYTSEKTKKIITKINAKKDVSNSSEVTAEIPTETENESPENLS
jgi:hypothetical protein